MKETFKTDVTTLKKIMIDKGYEKTIDLARASKIDRTTLGKILKGKAQPSSDVMYKLVATLEIPPHIAGDIFFSYNLRVA